MSLTRSTGILVAGMHRSGTSATAGALGLLGIALGPQLLEPGEDNPKGYWENERAVEIHDHLLASLGRRWDDVRALPRNWWAGPAGQEAEAHVHALVTRQFSGEPVWAVKDPRICRFLPIWLGVLPQLAVRPVVLFVVRHPEEVAASIRTRNGWPDAIGILLWLRHVLDAERSSRNVDRAVVSYEALIHDPVGTMSGALARLGVTPPIPPSAEVLRGFVEAGDRHHHHRPSSGPHARPFVVLALQVHDTLIRIAEGNDAWNQMREHADAFEAEWQRCGDELDAVAEMAGCFRDAEHVLRNKNRQLHSELGAQLEWAEAAVARYEEVQAERDRLRSDLTAQIRWSEEAVIAHEAVQIERDQLRSDLTAQIRWSEEAVERHRELVAERDACSAERDALAVELAALRAQHEELQRALAAMQASRSWRITRPLRAVSSLLGRRPSE